MLPFTSCSYYGSSSSSFETASNNWLNTSNTGLARLHALEVMSSTMMDGSAASNSSAFMTASRSTTETNKATAASKSHSEAERRRRERINGHLSTLRTLLPNTTKTDKASLLAEVVQHVKELKMKLAADVAVKEDEGCIYSRNQWWPFPRETDELTLTYCEAGEEEELMTSTSTTTTAAGLMIRVSLSCDDRPGLVADLTEALRSVRARLVKAEMATVGGRTKSVLVLQSSEAMNGREELGRLRRALKGVIDTSSVMPTTSNPMREVVPPGNKRLRFTHRMSN